MQMHRPLEYSAAALGVAGQLWDCTAASDLTACRSMHGLFGLFLCASIVARCWEDSAGAPAAPDWDRWLRASSRRLYILLYALAGIRLMLDAAVGAVPPPEIPVDYFVYGLLGLLTIRLLAAVGRSDRLPTRHDSSKRMALKMRLP